MIKWKTVGAAFVAATVGGLLLASCKIELVETNPPGDKTYTPGTIHDGTGKPANATDFNCATADDCGFWTCVCGEITVDAAVCWNGYCMGADGVCPAACDYYGVGWGGSANGGPDGSFSCEPDDFSCTSDVDCCSNVCASDGFCGYIPNQCLADDVQCFGDWECCSNFCADDGFCGVGTPICAPDNDPCFFDSDCCSEFCASDGFCGLGSECLPDNEACSFDADCCTNVCASDGFCGCLPVDVSCTFDSDCCSDFCLDGVCVP